MLSNFNFSVHTISSDVILLVISMIHLNIFIANDFSISVLSVIMGVKFYTSDCVLLNIP